MKGTIYKNRGLFIPQDVTNSINQILNSITYMRVALRGLYQRKEILQDQLDELFGLYDAMSLPASKFVMKKGDLMIMDLSAASTNGTFTNNAIYPISSETVTPNITTWTDGKMLIGDVETDIESNFIFYTDEVIFDTDYGKTYNNTDPTDMIDGSYDTLFKFYVCLPRFYQQGDYTHEMTLGDVKFVLEFTFPQPCFISTVTYRLLVGEMDRAAAHFSDKWDIVPHYYYEPNYALEIYDYIDAFRIYINGV